MTIEARHRVGICPFCEGPTYADENLIAISYDDQSGGWAHHEYDSTCRERKNAQEGGSNDAR